MPNSNFPKIGKPATQALEAAGYTNLKQLTKVTEAELAQLHGMGPKALGILREAFKAEGLSFKQGAGRGETEKERLACQPNGQGG
jgi:hypothetical protein